MGCHAGRSGSCLQTIAMDHPYTGMNITGMTGITEAQKMALKSLGAVEEETSVFQTAIN